MEGKLLYKELSYIIAGILFKAHNNLGRFCNEKQYGDFIEKLFRDLKIVYEREKVLPPSFAGERIGRNRIDFLINNEIILELKAKSIIERTDYAQTLRYLLALNKKLGLLVNFRGQYVNIKRVINPNGKIHNLHIGNLHIGKLAKLVNSYMQVKITRLDKTLPLPQYHTPGSVAFDFAARENVTVEPQTIAYIPTGLIIQTPPGYMLSVVARSSLAKKKGLMLGNGMGVIDQDYCGPEDEIKIMVYNFTNSPTTVEREERIAQGIFIRVDTAQWEEVDSITNASRGGFGSTG